VNHILVLKLQIHYFLKQNTSAKVLHLANTKRNFLDLRQWTILRVYAIQHRRFQK